MSLCAKLTKTAHIDRHAPLSSTFKGTFLYYYYHNLTVSKPQYPLNQNTDCLLPLLLQTKPALVKCIPHFRKQLQRHVTIVFTLHTYWTNKQTEKVKSTHLAHARLWTHSHIGSVNCTELIPTYIQQQESIKAHTWGQEVFPYIKYCFVFVVVIRWTSPCTGWLAIVPRETFKASMNQLYDIVSVYPFSCVLMWPQWCCWRSNKPAKYYSDTKILYSCWQTVTQYIPPEHLQYSLSGWEKKWGVNSFQISSQRRLWNSHCSHPTNIIYTTMLFSTKKNQTFSLLVWPR